MGKDLHSSIIPFIEKTLASHNKVIGIELIQDKEFYIYKLKRSTPLSDVIVVLSDDYYFGDYSIVKNHKVLKDGGFILIARPEATEYRGNDEANKIGAGKIGKLLGALNYNEVWNYIQPSDKN